MNTQFYWNPDFDYVKYAQGVWLLKNLSGFLTKNGLDLDDLADSSDKSANVSLVISGDFNARPSSSLIHLMHNQAYDPCKPKKYPNLPIAYFDEHGKEEFAKVEEQF